MVVVSLSVAAMMVVLTRLEVAINAAVDMGGGMGSDSGVDWELGY